MPIGSQFLPWQILTYAFLHGSLGHLLFNMFAVYMFGADMERVWGGRLYLIYYLVCAAVAALSQLLVTGITGAQYPTLGASGAVFGLLLAFARYYPERQILLLLLPVPLSARQFVVLYGALELVVLPENTYCLIFLKYFRREVNLVSSVIVSAEEDPEP